MIILNNHSTGFSDRITANSGFCTFLTVWIHCDNIGIGELWIDSEDGGSAKFKIPLAADYCSNDWLNENRKNPALRDYVNILQQMSTKSPVNSLIELDFAGDQVDIPNFVTDSKIALASWLKTVPLISFQSNPIWLTASIRAKHTHIDEAGDLVCCDVEIKNISSVKAALDYDVEVMIPKVGQQDDVVGIIKRSCKNIELCGDSEFSLSRWQHGLNLLHEVIRCIKLMNEYATRMAGLGGYKHVDLRATGISHGISGESQSVFNDEYLRREREFRIDDGTLQYFENHIKIGSIRLHFFVELSKNRIHIGYIGKHLRTKKY